MLGDDGHRFFYAVKRRHPSTTEEASAQRMISLQYRKPGKLEIQHIPYSTFRSSFYPKISEHQKCLSF